MYPWQQFYHVTRTPLMRPDLWLERGSAYWDWTLRAFGLEIVVSIPRRTQ